MRLQGQIKTVTTTFKAGTENNPGDTLLTRVVIEMEGLSPTTIAAIHKMQAKEIVAEVTTLQMELALDSKDA